MGESRVRSRVAGVAEEAARELLADLGRHRVCALLRHEHAIDYRHVDDRRLVALLAQAHRAGAPFLPDGEAGDGRARSEWITASVRGLGRVMLSTAGLKAGFTRVDFEALPNPAEAVDAIIAQADSRAVVVSFVGEGDVAAFRAAAPRGFGAPSDAAKPEDAALKAAFLAALLAGEVFLYRPAFESGEGVKTVAFDPTSKPKPLAKPAQTVVHWIEIALVDEDGAPLAGEAYQITLPDGDVRSGALDSAGKARLDGLTQSGSAQISFPNIDGREWKLA